MKKKWTRREFSKLAALQLGVVSLPPEVGSRASGNQAISQPLTAGPIQSAYSPASGQWEISWPERVSQHDVVYLSPPQDPTLGLPIGNGDLGALLWSTDNGLVFAINKSDAWDDDRPGDFNGWDREREELYTTLRHCGRLTIDFGCPVFDLLYQQSFEARLELASAIASFRAATPFAKVIAHSYVSAEYRVLVMHCEMSGTEPYGPQIKVERWGSRTFAHWYSQVNRDPQYGLEGTATSIERDRVVIHQKLRTLSFVLMAQVVRDGETIEPRKLHNRAAAVDLPGRERSEFTVYVTAVTSENEPDPLQAAHRILDRAVGAEAAIRQQHREQWKKFWHRSMVDLPEKYLENIWHTNLYLANSSSRGAYPPHFCNGLWGWNRDFVPWNWYFHWNEQWYAWPLAAANHPELADPYFRYRRAQLDHVMDYARRRLKKPGAFYADVSDRRGYNDAGLDHNHTPGAQIALDFWRHYAYTGDEAFLRNAAWPVIREVTRFNASCLKLGADGHYHISGTQAYEGSPLFDDTITDLAMIRALVPVAIRVGQKVGHEPSEIEHWQELLDKLASFHLVDLEPSEFERRGNELVHRGGLASGKPLQSRKVFAVGRESSGKWIRDRYAGRKETGYYGIPDPEIAPVFPAGVIGLADPNSELFRAAVTQIRLHPKTEVADPSALCEPASMAGGGGLCMGWCPYPIALARLGLAEELVSELINSVSTWQFYPQGFGHYGPYFVFKRDQEFRWNRNRPRDAGGPPPPRPERRFPFPTWPFRHFDNEAMPIVSCAINEMLIQSYDGTIRLCPAVPSTWNVQFDLAAAGGFRVSSEQRDGRILFVSLESRLGGRCRIQHPWPTENRLVCLDMTSGRVPQRVEWSEEDAGPGRVIRWETVARRRYLLIRNEEDLNTWKIRRESPLRRNTPRRLKSAVLGRDRLF